MLWSMIYGPWSILHMLTNIFSGTSGLVTPLKKTDYPPEFAGKSRLEYYASLFNSIEINSSFYRMPQVATVKKWADSVPENFRFTFKLSKTITHVKGLEFDLEQADLFMQTISNIGNHKGCVLIQFPPSQQNHISKLRELLTRISNADYESRWNIAIEFRHKSWYQENVYKLLEEFKAAMVIHDIPASTPPADEYESDIMYLRFHGPGGRYRGSYEDDFLHEYASYIRDWQKEGKSVYIYFNNTMGDALKNLMTLNDYINKNA